MHVVLYRYLAVITASLFVLSAPCRASDVPLNVSICALTENPAAFDKKRISVSGEVRVAFEDFSLRSPGCPSPAVTQIWLEFGGDVEAPTTYCCGSHSRKKGTDIQVEGFSLPLRKDDNLKRFLRLSKSGRKADDAKIITVKLIGTFFAGKPWKRSDGKIAYTGYGHLGLFSLLVIEQVTDSILTTGRMKPRKSP